MAGLTVRHAELLVSSAVKNLVAGSGITLDSRGTHTLKGISAPCELYRVAGVAL